VIGLARRKIEPDSYSWRATQWLMPTTGLIPAEKGMAHTTNIRVPIDDENTIHFRMHANVDGPLSERDVKNIEQFNIFAEMIPGTFMPKANISNDYLIDREDQRHHSFTGIKGIPVQDYAVTQDMGGGRIADRSREYLTASDAVIVAVRKRMLDAARALANGREPPEPANAKAYRVRPMQLVLPRAAHVFEAIRSEYLAEQELT
jgi:hypothetical protein